MIGEMMLYAGAVIIILWGVAHLIPTKLVVAGFGDISADNKQIITMEWVAEGLTLCFIGGLVLLLAVWVGTGNSVAVIVDRDSAVMLLVMAGWTLVTGARTAIVPIKICPIVKTVVALLFFFGSGL